MDAVRSSGGGIAGQQPPGQRDVVTVAVQPQQVVVDLLVAPALDAHERLGQDLRRGGGAVQEREIWDGNLPLNGDYGNCTCGNEGDEQHAVAGGICACPSECTVQNGWTPFLCPCLTYEKLKREYGLHGCLGRVKAVNLLVFGLLTAISWLCWSAPGRVSLLERSVSLVSDRGPEQSNWVFRCCYFGGTALTGLLVHSMREAYYRKFNLVPLPTDTCRCFGYLSVSGRFFVTSMICQPCVLAQMARHAWPASARQVGTGDQSGEGTCITLTVLDKELDKPAAAET
jgi:hypothetical protein